MSARKKIVCMLALIFCVVLAAPLATGHAEPQKALTLMVYLCGSNLESEGGAATLDLGEMAGSGVDTEQVNILTMTGGSGYWWTGQDPSTSLITCQDGDQVKVVWAGNSMNMGDPNTLEQFVSWSVQNYPAGKYALILWDHGGGPLGGVCVDELYGSDRLTLEEIEQALKNSALPGPLSWIGFDACLMSDLEVAVAMAPYAEYMIASQETEPGCGWNYSFLKGIEKDRDGRETGERIVEEYFKGIENSDGLTLSCLKLSAAGKLADAIGAFFNDVGRNLDTTVYSRLSRVRANATSFGPTGRRSGIYGYDLVDVGDLLAHCDGLGDPGKVLEALDELVVCNHTAATNASGVSMYHPILNKLYYRELWKDLYKKVSFSSKYRKYVQNFGDILTGKQLAEWSGLRIREEGTDEKGGSRFALKLRKSQAEHFSSAQLIVLAMTDRKYNGDVDVQLSEGGVSSERFDLAYYPVSAAGTALTEDRMLSGVFSGTSLYVTDENGQPVAGPLDYELSEDGEEMYINAYYQDQSGRDDARSPASVRFACTADDSTGQVYIRDIYVYDPALKSYTTRIPFTEENYTNLTIYRSGLVLPDGRGTLPGLDQWQKTGAWDIDLKLPMKWGLRFLDEQLSGTPLFATFEITDTQQNTFCTPLIRVENPNLQAIDVSPRVRTGPDFEMTLYTVLDTSVLNPGLSVGIELKNTSRETLNYQLDSLVLNGNRSVVGDRDDIHFLRIEPGKSEYRTLRIEKENLAGLNSLDEISFKLISYIGSQSYEPHGEGQYTYKLRGADLTVLGTEEFRPLAEQEDGDLTWQLISLKKNAQGGLDGTLRVVNRGEKQVIRYGNAVINELIQTPDRIHVDLAPHSDQYLSFTLSNEVKSSYISVSGKDTYYFLGLDHLLEQFGVEQVESLKLCMSLASHEHSILFRLPEPLYFASPGEIAKAGEEAPSGGAARLLLDGEISVNVDRILVGDNGVAARMTLRNNSSRDINLEMDDKTMNGESLKVNRDAYFLGAGAASVICVSFEPEWYREDEFSQVKELGMTFRYENYTTRRAYIRMNSPVKLGVRGGSYLSSGDFTTEKTEYLRPTGTMILPDQVKAEDCELSMSFSFTNRDDGAPEDASRNPERMAIRFTVSNRGTEKYTCRFRDVILNDFRYLGEELYGSCSVEAGETREQEIVLDRDTLTNLDEITSVAVTVNCSSGESYSRGTDYNFRFDVYDCDISEMTPKAGTPLCETVQDGLTWRLYSLDWSEREIFDGLIYVRNDTDEQQGDDFARVQVNGVEIMGSANVQLPAHTELFTRFSFFNEVSRSPSLKTENKDIPNPFITQALQQMGFSEVSTLGLAATDYHNTLVTYVLFRLPKPVKLPKLKGSDTLQKNAVLLAGDVSVEISHIMTGDNGAMPVLLLKNDRDVPSQVTFKFLEAEGRNLSLYQSYRLPPHTVVIDDLVCSLEDQLPARGKYKELKFTFTVDNSMYEGASVRLKRPAALGDGRLLSASDFTVREGKLRNVPAVYEKVAVPNPDRVSSGKLEPRVSKEKAENFDYGYAVIYQTGKVDLADESGGKTEHPCLRERARIPLSLNKGRIEAPFSGMSLYSGAQEIPRKGNNAGLQVDLLIFTKDDPIPEDFPGDADPFSLNQGIHARYEWTLQYGKKIQVTKPVCRMTDLVTGQEVDPEGLAPKRISGIYSWSRVRITDDPALSYYEKTTLEAPRVMSLSPLTAGEDKYRVIYELHYKDGSYEEIESSY